MGRFEEDLRSLLNIHNIDTVTDTPDYILARYVVASLKAYRFTVEDRDYWYGKE